ncbi:MAG: hypothetical protein COA37_02735 [Hoeflea sp.]|uniref:hypothetical protein n=1 Tax=Hoeflea sp. TaxID=1940281 RepID=UPI000C10710F|nr:hypothetical protein [Hoeflea sp.]PHR25756.1 MAG: hypothetical protein COA37_02735 [Hoeflea sp.]
MTERYTLKQNLYVRASMFTTEELRRQKRLGLSDINEDILNGLVQQRMHFEGQQQNMVRALAVALFLTFVSWNGGDIVIPGTGTSVGGVPAFLELSLLTSAFSVLMITYSFLSIQMYNSVIAAIAQSVLAKNELDADLFAASKVPTWLFVKYAQKAPVNGRVPGFNISTLGNFYNRLLIGSLAFVLLSAWIFAIICILYIAHDGLSDTVAGWSVYLLCIGLIAVACISMAANVLEFEHEMDFDNLESTAGNETDAT